MRYKFRSHPSKLATLMITYCAGSRVEFDREYPAGIAHYMEHVRFKGTEKYTSKDLLRKTADAGGSWNAWTSKDMVAYHMTIPEENLETAFECLAEIALAPIFPQNELDKEKEVVCQEIRMYDDYLETLVSNKLMQSAFSNALANSIIGTEDSVRSITRQHLIDFNTEFYSKQHMLISLAANADHSNLVEKYFGIPDDVLLIPPTKNVQYGPSVKHIIKKEGQLQNIISIGLGSNQIERLQKTERAKVRVFSSIFGGDTSRLFLKVREDLGLVYGIGAGMADHMDGSLYSIETSTEPENSDKVIDAINKEMKNFLLNPATKEELNRAKNIIKSRFYGSLDSSSESIYQIITEEFFGYKTGSEYLAEIEAVTLDDVQDVAEKIFTSGNVYTVVGTGKQ